MAIHSKCPKCCGRLKLNMEDAGTRQYCDHCNAPYEFSVTRDQNERPVLYICQSLTPKQKKKQNARRAANQQALVAKRQMVIGFACVGSIILVLIAAGGILGYKHVTSFESRLSQLASSNESTVETARYALTEGGYEAVPFLVKGLKGESGKVRDHCLDVLAALGEDGKVGLDELMSGLNHDSAEVRRSCVTAVSFLGHSGRTAEAKLVELLRDDNENVRQAAFTCLTQIAPPHTVVTKLIEMLADSGFESKKDVVTWIGACGEDAKDAAPVLLPLLTTADRGNVQLRRSVYLSLGLIGNAEPQVLTALLEVVTDQEELFELRKAGCQSLELFGKSDFQIATTLLTILANEDESLEMKQTVGHTLTGFGGMPIVESLSEMLASTEDADTLTVCVENLRDLSGELENTKVIANSLNVTKNRLGDYETAELEDARRREYAKPRKLEEWKNVLIDGDTTKEWKSYKEEKRPKFLGNHVRFFSVFVSSSSGPSEDALREEQDNISEKWRRVRIAIETAIAAIQR